MRDKLERILHIAAGVGLVLAVSGLYDSHNISAVEAWVGWMLGGGSAIVAISRRE